jgi:N-acetylglucosaminyldiphosphoundecaprenol N-acetyl-beta-D-mannosaminyltransferase
VLVLVSPHAGVAGELVRDGVNGRVLALDLSAWIEAASAWLADPVALTAVSRRAALSVHPYHFENAAAGIVDAARHAFSGSRPTPGLSRFLADTAIAGDSLQAMKAPAAPRVVRPVLGVPIDVVTDSQAASTIAAWARQRESRMVCLCNAHSVVTAGSDPSFLRVLTQADLATADGSPVAWMLRRLGAVGQRRVNGPDLMIDCCAAAAATGEAVFLYGGAEKTLTHLRAALLRRWPTLRIAGAIAPPFRPLTPEEDAEIVRTINASGAGIVWVGLGCPKQELWMAEHRGRIHAVMVGVGAAFDFHSGIVKRAPRWAREHGLEWLHRLAREPRRLGRRYLTTNFIFIVRAARQLWQRRGGDDLKRHASD